MKLTYFELLLRLLRVQILAGVASTYFNFLSTSKTQILRDVSKHEGNSHIVEDLLESRKADADITNTNKIMHVDQHIFIFINLDMDCILKSSP